MNLPNALTKGCCPLEHASVTETLVLKACNCKPLLPYKAELCTVALALSHVLMPLKLTSPLLLLLDLLKRLPRDSEIKRFIEKFCWWQNVQIFSSKKFRGLIFWKFWFNWDWSRLHVGVKYGNYLFGDMKKLACFIT